MKAFLGFVSITTLACFTSFFSYSLQKGISTHLEELAAQALQENGIQGVSVEFEYFDGRIFGADTPALEQQVREALAGELAVGRLLFARQPNGRESIDLSFPDQESTYLEREDVIDSYATSLVLGESLVKGGRLPESSTSLVHNYPQVRSAVFQESKTSQEATASTEAIRNDPGALSTKLSPSMTAFATAEPTVSDKNPPKLADDSDKLSLLTKQHVQETQTLRDANATKSNQTEQGTVPLDTDLVEDRNCHCDS